MKSHVKVSIIIPVYNVESYLDECVKSVLKQTFEDFEIILVNDGSTDFSGEMCKTYQEIDKRIRVLHKENGGLSSARNVGIDNAKGEYLVFIDSDDAVHPDYLNTLISLAEKYSADLVVCGFIKSERCVWQICDEKVEIRTGTEILCRINDNDVVMTVTWNKLYHRKFFDDFSIRFPEGKIHEDMFFTPQIFLHAQKMVISNKKLYFYRQRSNSIMTSDFSPKRLDVFDSLEFRIQFFKNNGFEELLADEYEKYIRKFCEIYPKIKKQKYKFFNEQNKIMNKAKSFLFDKNVFYKLSFKYKIKLLLFVLFEF